MEVLFNVPGVNSGRKFLFENNVITRQSRRATINWDVNLSPTVYKPNQLWLYNSVRLIDRYIVDCRLAILNNTPGRYAEQFKPGSYDARRLLWMHDTLFALRRYRTFCSRFAAQMKRTSSRQSSEGDFSLAQYLEFL